VIDDQIQNFSQVFWDPSTELGWDWLRGWVLWQRTLKFRRSI
jgi:hypothetical protein